MTPLSLVRIPGWLDRGEDPADCVVRELEEELAVRVSLGPILDSWLYDIESRVQVVIITYACATPAGLGRECLEISHEHKALGLFGLDEIDGLHMPEGYRRSIRRAAAGLHVSESWPPAPVPPSGVMPRW